MLHDLGWRVRVVILSVVMEPVRFLCHHFMKCSFENIDLPRNTFSSAMNLLNPQSSLVVAGLQYWSELLAWPAQSERLRLIYLHRNCANFAEWQSAWPGDVEILQKTILAASAQLWRRVHLRAEQEMGIFSLADIRLGPTVVQTLKRDK